MKDVHKVYTTMACGFKFFSHWCSDLKSMTLDVIDGLIKMLLINHGIRGNAYFPVIFEILMSSLKHNNMFDILIACLDLHISLKLRQNRLIFFSNTPHSMGNLSFMYV